MILSADSDRNQTRSSLVPSVVTPKFMKEKQEHVFVTLNTD